MLSSRKPQANRSSTEKTVSEKPDSVSGARTNAEQGNNANNGSTKKSPESTVSEGLK